MGTFHQNKHELHGITIVVETDGPELYVGRCDDIDDRGVTLHDAECHRDGASGSSRAEYLGRAVRVGVFPRLRSVVVPGRSVVSIRRLADLG